MSQEEISQLIENCNHRKEALRSYRDQINESQKRLLKVAANRLDKDDLTDLEHYQNQFHIQLINIHDLKHELKNHDSRLSSGQRQAEHLPPDMMQENSRLNDEYRALEERLNELNTEFEVFLQRPH